MDEAEFKRYLESQVQLRKTNELILGLLERNYGIVMKIRTLKKYLNKFGIRRVNRAVPPAVIANAIQREQSGPGTNYGYRFLHNALRNRHGLSVSRQTVQNMLSTMGRGRMFAAARAFPWHRCMRYCPGPNYRWSEDGHDKLGKYDIYIHGCIDEYSRHIMWARAFVNNRKSEIVAAYYLSAVRQFGVAPDTVVSDFGRESTLIARFQALFHANDRNPASHHSWTFSVRNVTIESWWRRLRQMCTLYWHEEFVELENEGLWTGDIVDRWALVSVYLPLINSDLDRAVFDHNTHTIRAQRGRIRPGGQPEDLYNMPEHFGGKRRGRAVKAAEVDTIEAMYNIPRIDSLLATPQEVEEVVKDFFWRNQVEIDRENARTLYLQVRALLNGICA